MIHSAQPHIQVRIAATPDEYAEAFRIAYEVYYSKGFAHYSEYGMRATPYQFRPGAIVFLTLVDGDPVATLSIYEGRGSDLPSASGWPNELGGIQARGFRVFELGALMVRPNGPHSGNARVCLEMFRAAWRYARRLRKARAFCAFVQAHHQAYYEKMFGFQPFGPPKDYSWNGLNINAVVPLLLDLDCAGPEYDQRFTRYGESPRNLHWFFVHDTKSNVDAILQSDLSRRAELDMASLRQEFAHLLPEEAKDVRHRALDLEQSWSPAQDEQMAHGLHAAMPCAVAS